MQIKVIDVSEPVSKQGAKASYEMIEVTHSVDGRPGIKKLMSFSGDIYKVFVNAKKGEIYDVKTDKDAKGYWQWSAATKIDGAGTDAGPSQSAQTSRSSGGSGGASAYRQDRYESPEERAARQVAISRQNALGNAVRFLAPRVKATEADVFRLAEAFVGFINKSPIEFNGSDAVGVASEATGGATSIQ